MRAEEMTKRVVIQRPSTAVNALNESIGGWENVVTAGDGALWAAVIDMKGHQYIAAGAAQNAIVTRVTIRKRGDIEAAMRVVHGAEVYDITAVLDRTDHFMDLMCIRGVSNG
jgi:SPP1 family predicted phage head-tail adaptor